MSDSKPLTTFQLAGASVSIYEDTAQLSAAAATKAAGFIRTAIAARGRARIIVATGNSQIEFIRCLAEQPDIDWSAVEAFHLDEYVGLPDTHPASFRRWVKTRFVDKVHPGTAHLLNGNATSLDAELARYADLLNSAPIDVAFIGIGENGHLAFNDPHVADFKDPLTVKRVDLDEACKRQQAGEGHFPDVASVPDYAITVTCPALMRVNNWICCVPDERKAIAVRNSLEGPVSETCPGSLIQRHPSAFVYLDRAAASLLTARS